MDLQGVSIQKVIVWVVAWIVVLALVAGLILWKAPIGDVENAAAGPVTGEIAPSSQQAPPPVETLPAEYPLFFPLLFKNGGPAWPWPPVATPSPPE
jgi:hypothetical protein